jgi:hypothetical protein
MNIEKHSLQQHFLQKVHSIGLRTLELKVEAQMVHSLVADIVVWLVIFIYEPKIKIQFFFIDQILSKNYKSYRESNLV